MNVDTTFFFNSFLISLDLSLSFSHTPRSWNQSCCRNLLYYILRKNFLLAAIDYNEREARTMCPLWRASVNQWMKARTQVYIYILFTTAPSQLVILECSTTGRGWFRRARMHEDTCFQVRGERKRALKKKKNRTRVMLHAYYTHSPRDSEDCESLDESERSDLRGKWESPRIGLLCHGCCCVYISLNGKRNVHQSWERVAFEV